MDIANFFQNSFRYTVILVVFLGVSTITIVFSEPIPKSKSLKSRGCPNLPTQDNFNITKFAGKWYEYLKLVPAESAAVTPKDLKCSSFEINMNVNSTTRGRIETRSRVIGTGFNVEVDGKLFIPHTTEPAKILLEFIPGSFFVNYWVLATDYVRFAFVYSCNPNPINPGTVVEYMSIVTRKRGELIRPILYSVKKLLSAFFKNIHLFPVLSSHHGCQDIPISRTAFFSDIV